MVAERWLHSWLMHIRPAQAGDLAKRLLCIRRTVMFSKTGHRFLADPVSILGMQLSGAAIFEPHMTELLYLLLRPSDVFIDVGGNEGYFSVVAASLVGDGTVHCIEPQSRLQEYLRENFALNQSKVTLHQCALADRIGAVDLFLRPSINSGASSMFRHWRVGTKSERVPCVTLDSFFREHSIERAKLIKIDCEGAEGLVVNGAAQVFAEGRADFIAMEYHRSICGARSCDDTHEHLTRFGYVLTTIPGLAIYHLPNLKETLRAAS
jgi:FkbM family methyltransferase